MLISSYNTFKNQNSHSSFKLSHLLVGCCDEVKATFFFSVVSKTPEVPSADRGEAARHRPDRGHPVWFGWSRLPPDCWTIWPGQNIPPSAFFLFRCYRFVQKVECRTCLFPFSGKRHPYRPRVHHPEPAALSHCRGSRCQDCCERAVPCGECPASGAPHQSGAVSTSLHLPVDSVTLYDYCVSDILLFLLLYRLTEILSNAPNGDQVKRVLNPLLRK